MGIRGAWVVAAAVSLAACGSAPASTTMSVPETALSTSNPATSHRIEGSAPELATTIVSADASPSSSVPVETGPPDTSLPSPDQVRWLAPPDDVDGLRLVEARRELVADCGPVDDCALTLPASTLRFDTADLTTARSLSLHQRLAGSGSFEQVPLPGEPRTVGVRGVIVDEQGPPELPYVVAAWSEPGDIDVELQANLPWTEVEAFIASLRPVDAEAWPGIDVDEPLGRCVGERTQYAPAEVPEGWGRFVLEAAPVGTCDVGSFLFMSLVIPGTLDQPGTLVTVISSPASAGPITAGEPVDVNGATAYLEETVQSDGSPASSIFMEVGDARIGAHGNVNPATLIELMGTVRLLDDDEWSQLVAEIDAG